MQSDAILGTARSEPTAPPTTCRDPQFHHEDGSLRWASTPDGMSDERWAAVLRAHRDTTHGLTP